ncbi:MAG: ATP-binding cassette domain-containing protein [Planctomycetota bacterium]
MSNAIELRQVRKTFGKNVAVNDVDLVVPEGAIYGFIGPNGSGKTTTLRMILRIFQPDSGEVVVLGQATGKTADDRLGYLPEERGLYKRMKVFELLTYYARLKGFYDCRGEIDSWLERLGASDWANKKIDALSKGMAQKVQFISAVVAKPELVILDEPFSGLDPVNMESLRDAILHLRQLGTTIIFSTHDMDMAEKLCDGVFMIFQGNKVLDGTMDEIQADYASNRIRVALSSADNTLPELHGVLETLPKGRYYDLVLADTSQAQSVLHQLTSQREIQHFEIVKPSLHDIFVSIARPEEVLAASKEEALA